MTQPSVLLFLIETIVPYTYLLNAAFVFTIIVVNILLFIAFFLQRNRKRQQRKMQLRSLFSDLIAETILCDSEEERNTTLEAFLAEKNGLLAKPFPRKILIREIVRSKDSISGSSAENLRWLYETLELDKDTLERFSSKEWYRKACAIQQFAEMQQNKYLVRIYRETNNKNSLIRAEAQIAVVKLTGFKGLRFLNIISYPVSQWQQLALINHLQEGEIEEEKISSWLASKNETVVEFALRLIEIYKCYDLHDEVILSLQHSSSTVRLQALQAIKEIHNEDTTEALLQHFQHASRQEQMEILEMLPETGAGNRELTFVTSLLQHQDEAIRFRAMRTIEEVSPAWSTRVIRQVKDNPSFTYILSSLEKKAV